MTYSPFRHIPSVFRKHRPIQLTFFLTRRCNARCPFCFYLSGKDNGEEKTSELSLGEIEKLSSSIGSLFWLAFSGGEIFLRDDLVEITRLFYEKNKPAVILLPTNGLLTDLIAVRVEAILKYCEKSTIVVKLSLEGLGPLHDSMRRVNEGFHKTMLTYKALGELVDRYPNLELGINTVFCSTNQNRIEEITEFVNGLEKIKTHTVSLIRGEVPDGRLKEVDPRKYYETIKKMESSLKKGKSSIYGFRGGRLKAAQDILQRRLIYDTMLQKRRLIPCYAGRLNLVLTESGDIYPCESFAMRIGNVRRSGYDIKKLLETERARKVIRSIQNNACYCTNECYFMTNILFNPSMYPALLKEYMQL